MKFRIIFQKFFCLIVVLRFNPEDFFPKTYPTFQIVVIGSDNRAFRLFQFYLLRAFLALQKILQTSHLFQSLTFIVIGRNFLKLTFSVKIKRKIFSKFSALFFLVDLFNLYCILRFQFTNKFIQYSIHHNYHIGTIQCFPIRHNSRM